MGITPPVGPGWSPPPPEECVESDSYTLFLTDADPPVERVKIRLTNGLPGMELVDFALVHETYYKRQWRTVAVADSSHDNEVHVHQYGRKTDRRIGKPDHICPIGRVADVTAGYDLAYDRVVSDWSTNRRRWHDG